MCSELREEDFILGLLLHDIGKLLIKDEVYRKNFREKKDYYFQKYNEKGGYLHSFLGAFWLEENFQGQSLDLTIPINISACHHDENLPGESVLPKKAFWATKLSDWLSSGERESLEDDESVTFEDLLVNVFSGIGNAGDKNLFYPARNICIDAIYPGKERGDISSLIHSLKRSLKCSFSRPSVKDNKNLWSSKILESVFYVLLTHLWSIPAQTKRAGYMPDISLFSHLKLSAAIFPCLFRKFDSDKLKEFVDTLKNHSFKIDTLKKEKKEEKIATLFCGDISGIQNFIFNIPSKGAAKSLKGRSAYIDILLEVIARYVLREFNLPRTNLIYIGGGNFLILAPLSLSSDLEKIEKSIQTKLFSAHGLDLTMNFSWQDLTLEDFFTDGFSKKMSFYIHEELSLKKLSKMRFVESLFDPPPPITEENICSLCGKTIDKNAIVGDEEEVLCNFCDSLRDIGRRLKDTRIISYIEVPYEKSGEGYNKVFSKFGFMVRFCQEKDSLWTYRLGYLKEKDQSIDFSKFCGFKLLPGGIKPNVEFNDIANHAEGKLIGDDMVKNALSNGNVIVSSLYYGKDDTFYLPLPKMKLDIPPKKRKEIKDIRFIPQSLWQYLPKEDPLILDLDFFSKIENRMTQKLHPIERRRVTVDRLSFSSNPYLEEYIFVEKSAFLFFFISYPKGLDTHLERVLRVLPKEGIGGNRSTGSGFFDSFDILDVSLEESSNYFVSLSLFIPNSSERESLKFYGLSKRGGGFIYQGFGTTGRKPIFTVVTEGSILKKRIEGKVLKYDVPYTYFYFAKPFLIPLGCSMRWKA